MLADASPALLLHRIVRISICVIGGTNHLRFTSHDLPFPTVKLYIGITDFDWFSLHASKEFVEEVNFWRPSAQANFKVLQRGEP